MRSLKHLWLAHANVSGSPDDLPPSLDEHLGGRGVSCFLIFCAYVSHMFRGTYFCQRRNLAGGTGAESRMRLASWAADFFANKDSHRIWVRHSPIR